jgi:hemolysin activation/secretion protein
MICIRNFIYFLPVFIFIPYVQANGTDMNLIGIVKVLKANVRDRNIPLDKYIVDSYDLGTVVELNYCDKYDWCKLKEKNLYISKASLGVMSFIQEPLKDINKTTQAQHITEPKTSNHTEQCIRLKHINLDENDILDSEVQDKLFTPYYDKCLSQKTIKSFLSVISQYYIDKGYITTKPYLQEQNILDGQIDVTILKGKVEDILHSETNATSWKIATAFAGQKNETLNLRDLETSLEMMNRVDSADSNFELQPGSKNGGSIVVIKTENFFPIHLTLGASGRGSINDNNPSLTGILSIDNLLQINDILTYTYNGSRIQKEYQSTEGSELNYSFPIGSYLVELIGSKFLYRQGVEGINDTYLSNGETLGARLVAGKVVSRNQTNKFEIKLSVHHKNTKNYFENELIEVSSYKTTLFQADLIHTNYQNWGQNYTVYSVYQGKDWFGARSDLQNSEETDYSETAELEFTKYSIDNTLYYYFNDRTYNISSNFHVQYTQDNLPNNDKLTVGSDYTVRGYDTSSYYGNNAYYFKNDLSKTFFLNLHKYFLQTLSLFVGLDSGYVWHESDNKGASGEIYGQAIGFSTSSDNLSSSFMWSKPISSDFAEETLFSFNVMLKF